MKQSVLARWITLLVCTGCCCAAAGYYLQTELGLMSGRQRETPFLSGSDYRTEFAREVRRLDWPVASQRPKLPPIHRDTIYEVGVGKSDAQSAWLCAWEVDFLDARSVGDADRALVALSAAKSVRRLQLWDAYETELRDAVDRRLRRAAGGDVVMVRDEVERNCQRVE
jgi:hypothetical protein